MSTRHERFVVRAVFATLAALSFIRSDIVIGAYMDTWILPIDHHDGGGLITLPGAGYAGTDAYEHSGSAGDITRIYWALTGQSEFDHEPFPTTTELYRIDAWAPTAGPGNWQPIESQIRGAAGADSAGVDPLIPWVGAFGTNHQWIASQFSAAARGTWVTSGPGPHTPESNLSSAGANGTLMWLKSGSWLYAKWDFSFSIDRAWSALRVTQISTDSWIGSTGTFATDWGTGTNWASPASVPVGNESPIFGSSATIRQTCDLGGDNRQLGGMQFYANKAMLIQSSQIDPGTSLPYTLTLADLPNAVVSVAGNSHQISAPLVLGSDVEFSLAVASAVLTVSGEVSGPYAVTKDGAGTLIFGGDSSPGALAVNGGKLVVTGTGSVGGATDVSAGTLQVDGAWTASVMNVTASGALGGRGSGQLAGSGTITLTGDDLYYNSTATSTFSGKLASNSSAAGLKVDNGTLILSGTNMLTGGTNVAGGKLIVASDTAMVDGTSLTVGASASLLFNASMVGSPASSIKPVPEPGTLALLTAGALLVFAAWLPKRDYWAIHN
jgi:autotransporter-associated beta strand protein